jgi:riboflavin-specific deaminase-like protein
MSNKERFIPLMYHKAYDYIVAMNYHNQLTHLASLAWHHRRQTNFKFGYACMIIQGNQEIIIPNFTIETLLTFQEARGATLLFVHPFSDAKDMELMSDTLQPQKIIFAMTLTPSPTLTQVMTIHDQSILEATWLKRYYQQLQRGRRPWITLSYGMAMDGKIATYTGDSKYRTGPEARQVVHQLRHQHHGILVGIQTVQIDHPLLTTRLEGSVGDDANRIVLDSTLSIASDEKILSLQSSAKTYIVCKQGVDQTKVKQLENLGVIVLIDPTKDTPRINLTWLMQTLKQSGIDSLLVEGGGTVHFSFIEQGFVDMIVAQVSPLIIGGHHAKTPVEGAGFATLQQAQSFAFARYWQVGSDIILIATPTKQP